MTSGGGRKKKKQKAQTLNIHEFLSAGSATPHAAAVVVPKNNDWADQAADSTDYPRK